MTTMWEAHRHGYASLSHLAELPGERGDERTVMELRIRRGRSCPPHGHRIGRVAVGPGSFVLDIFR